MPIETYKNFIRKRLLEMGATQRGKWHPIVDLVCLFSQTLLIMIGNILCDTIQLNKWLHLKDLNKLLLGFILFYFVLFYKQY